MKITIKLLYELLKKADYFSIATLEGHEPEYLIEFCNCNIEIIRAGDKIFIYTNSFYSNDATYIIKDQPVIEIQENGNIHIGEYIIRFFQKIDLTKIIDTLI